MAVKIRLRRQGRNNLDCYRIVAANARSPRDGRHLEILGFYHPEEKEDEKRLKLDSERVKVWLARGAQLTETVRSLVMQIAPTVISDIETARTKAAIEKRQAKKVVAAK